MKEGNMRQEQEGVTGDPKTLTPKAMTLEEFLAELGNERNASLARYTYPDGTEQWAVYDSWTKQIAWAHTWPELATKLRGVPVVARDEAAELRAAIREFFKAEAAVAALYHPNGTYTDFHEAADIANTARENLRRLAGGENEK